MLVIFLKIVSSYFTEFNLWKSQGSKQGVAFLQREVLLFDSTGRSGMQLVKDLLSCSFRTKVGISGIIPTSCSMPPSLVSLSWTGTGTCPWHFWLLCFSYCSLCLVEVTFFPFDLSTSPSKPLQCMLVLIQISIKLSYS